MESTFSMKKPKLCPSWCGSMDWVPAYKPKGYQYDSLSGHMPVLWARCPAGGEREATNWCFSHTQIFLSLFLPPLSLKINNKTFLKKEENAIQKKKKKKGKTRNSSFHFSKALPTVKLSDVLLSKFHLANLHFSLSKYGTLHKFACYPSTGSMLIFSVSFQFLLYKYELPKQARIYNFVVTKDH